MSAIFEKDTGYLDQMKFSSPIEEAKQQIAALKMQGVDAIVVIVHMGNVVIGQTANDMIPQRKNHGVSIAFSKDTGMS